MVPAEVEVPSLTVLALITESGEKLPDQYKLAADEIIRAEPEPENFPALAAGSLSPSATVVAITIRAVPAARKLAKSHGLDLSKMQGSGPDGIILLKDVKSAMAIEQKKPKVMASNSCARCGRTRTSTPAGARSTTCAPSKTRVVATTHGSALASKETTARPTATTQTASGSSRNARGLHRSGTRLPPVDRVVYAGALAGNRCLA